MASAWIHMAKITKILEVLQVVAFQTIDNNDLNIGFLTSIKKKTNSADLKLQTPNIT